MRTEAGCLPPEADDVDPLRTWPFSCVSIDQLVLAIAKRVADYASIFASSQFFALLRKERRSRYFWVPLNIVRLGYRSDPRRR